MSRVRRRQVLWMGLIAVVGAVGVVQRLWRDDGPTPEPSPPVLWPAPDFELTERSGRLVRRTDLDGRIWIADFIFTRCMGICPPMSRAMAQLQADLPDVSLVTFSVDPETDTPEVLAAYARQFDADPDRWWFLTGDRAKIYAVAGEGFKLGVARTNTVEPITHSNRLMLVDRHGRVRGAYPADDAEALKRLRRDVATLRREP